ncbi:MAG: nucleotidyl transferase AbiEii/AbiGii toxin family protein [bacterium]
MEVTFFLKDLVNKSKTENKLFKRNVLKEYLQILVLDFIYSNPEYSGMFFYGGSCLMHCFGLNRLSEDLDFVDIKKSIDISKLAKDLENYFKNNTDQNLIVTIQKFRIYLKFPLLFELGLAEKNESDLLFLKIEVFKEFDFCKKYKTEIIPLFKFNKSILIKTFDLPTLMSTKIRAILYRKWEKTNKDGEILIKAKGRDYFDLMWYLEKGIKPNINCIENIKNNDELREKLLKVIEKVDSKSITLDLESFIDKKDFVKKLSKNIKNILKRNLEKL